MGVTQLLYEKLAVGDVVDRVTVVRKMGFPLTYQTTQFDLFPILIVL